jgi:hypothetical protein
MGELVNLAVGDDGENAKANLCEISLPSMARRSGQE